MQRLLYNVLRNMQTKWQALYISHIVHNTLFRGSYAHFTKRLRRLPQVVQPDKNQDTSQACLALASRQDVSAGAGDMGPTFPFLSASLFLGNSKLCRSTLRNMYLSDCFLKNVSH